VLSVVSLAKAREEAAAMRKVARSGGDPIAARRAERRVVPTFADAARRVHAEQAPSWRNAKHGAQWLATLEAYASPVFGEKRVDDVATADVLQVLSPIWLEKAETARRVRQRIATVMDWAHAAGHRSGENPVQGVAKGLPKQKRKDAHHAALPFDAVPDFVAALQASGASLSVKLGFEFLILTAARTSEVIHAQPAEIDLEASVWTIPAERMKAERAHRVPLVGRAAAIAAQAIEAFPNAPFLFPGQRAHRPLSNMAFLTALRRMKVDVTAHGFRSAFRDWASERTSFPADVCEMALAHAVRDKTEAAYRRGDLFEKRRALMAA